MLNQSFRQVFVSNIPALLPQGKTVENLAVGQIGILNGASYVATETPTYGTDKAIRVVWGTPDLPPAFFFGFNNQNEYSKLIKGKLVRNFRGKKASRGQHQIVTIGFSGDVSDNDTLFAKQGEHREIFLNLTGDAIDREFSTQGLQRRYYFKEEFSADDCADTCVPVDCRKISEYFVKQINADPNVNRYVKASVVTSCDPAVAAGPSITVYKYKLTLADNKDAASLGLVQAQYPDFKVKRIGEDGAASVYEAVRNTNALPAAYSNAGNTVITNCDVCPPGYTKVAGVDGGRDICELTTPTTTAWQANGTAKRFAKAYRLTLADDICGNDRLTDVQAAYPDAVVTLVDAAGDCVHTYETTVYSQPVQDGCSIDLLQYIAPEKFEGSLWIEVPAAPLADGTVCKCGIRLEVAVVHRTTNDATFQYFPYDASAVFLEVAAGANADYNSTVPLENEWVVKQIQGVKFPQGDGGYIQALEKDSLAYNLRFRADNPVLREIEGYEFQAKNGIFYDEYVLEFDFSYMVGGWSQKYTDSYSLFVYFPEGQGKEFEAAINSYIQSANIDIDPVIL